MDDTLTQFTHALRNARVEVSPAETLLAAEIWQQLGISDRNLLRHGLSMALAKNPRDKQRFDRCFEQFFSVRAFAEPPKNMMLPADDAALRQLVAEGLPPRLGGLVAQVLNRRMPELGLWLQQAGLDAGVTRMQHLRDKPRAVRQITAAMGVDQLLPLVRQAQGPDAASLAYVRRYLLEQIQRYVDLQFSLLAETGARQAVQAAALQGNLASISPEYQQQVEAAVREVADRLRRRHRRHSRHGPARGLDIGVLLRRNMAHDGHLFKLYWRRRKRRANKIFILCDVSGSMARLSRFLLLLVSLLSDLLPAVRAFVFSSQMSEVTARLAGTSGRAATAQVIESIILDWGNGSTDYGHAFRRFREAAGTQLDSRSTVLILGDGRNNFFPPQAEVLYAISRRARQVVWLNPETAQQWREGDSEMLRYRGACRQVLKLANLRDLQRVAELLIAQR